MYLHNLPSNNIYSYFKDHLFEVALFDGHPITVIKFILNKYLTVRIHHETKIMLQKSVESRVRSVLTKSILFKNQ